MLLLLALACSGTEPDPDPNLDDTSSLPTSETADTGEDPCLTGELVHDPAVGSYELEPLVEGMTLVLLQGPQGGYHIDMNGSLEPVPNAGVVVAAELLLDDGTQVAFTDGAQAAFDSWDACRGVYSKARMFWISSLDAATLCGFVGRPATLTQTVEDLGSERSTSASFDVTFDVDLFEGTCADVL